MTFIKKDQLLQAVTEATHELISNNEPGKGNRRIYSVARVKNEC